jgi:hypothetical protein
MYDPLGRTNNVCVRVDDRDYLFGNPGIVYLGTSEPKVALDPVAHWVEQRVPLGSDASGRVREGARSVWRITGRDDRPCRIDVTQHVEVVPGEQSGRFDTCLVRYTLVNRDASAHEVGIRFLLDTYIGGNDGVPFTIPGQPGLCSTSRSFDRPGDVPDYVQALERESLLEPGTVAHLQFRTTAELESPTRVLLGGYPELPLQKLFPKAHGWLTGWDVPLLNIRELVDHRDELANLLREPEPDSAVTLYWDVQTLRPGRRREVGFRYGLGQVSSSEAGGKLLLTVGGRTVRDGEFTLTALRSSPVRGERLTLRQPSGGGIEVLSPAEQIVPPIASGSPRAISTVTWKLRGQRVGRFKLVVESTAGVRQHQSVRVHPPSSGVLD